MVKYYIAFSHFLGVGPVRFTALIKKFQTVKKAYLAPENQLAEMIGQGLAQRFVRFRAAFDPVKKLEEFKKKEIKVLTLENENYPAILKNIADPPICLYVKGDVNIFSDSALTNSGDSVSQKPSSRRKAQLKMMSSAPYEGPFRFSTPAKFANKTFFAIVGTRKPTSYGERIVKKFAYELSSAGFVIVSGMAMGIDTFAHQSAIAAGGKTIAVLGCGVDIIYPAVNSNLYHQIIKKGGAIISEFPPGRTVLKGLFIARNRIISGLSVGVLVVEGAKDSGALITARYAAEQGREVFAPPGPLTSPMSQAPNLLLKQGAKLVTSVEDIYEELGLRLMPKKKEAIRENLDDKEKMVFDLLIEEPLLADEIAVKTNQPIETILNTVSLLEIKGVIEKNNEGKYQLKI